MSQDDYFALKILKLFKLKKGVNTKKFEKKPSLEKS